MNILTVIGARPQFVKSAVVSRQINLTVGIEERIIHTGQHFDPNMSDIFFEQMGIPVPDFQLEVSGLSHGAMTGRMLEQIEEILLEQKPDLVMVYGDTNSTLAGALAASKLHIPVAHVEAGLRSFNMKMPEEINRILTDRLSHILLCPTQAAVVNLEREGYSHFDTRVVNCGDVMQDAALYYTSKEQQPVIDVDLSNGFVLSTIHRAENTDNPESLARIFAALNEIQKNLPVILPIHPRTRMKLKQFNIDSRIHLIDPVGYLEMIFLLKRCELVMTDSGGLQKEAFFFQKPCVTLRHETEWTELVEGGFNILAGDDTNRIIKAYRQVIGIAVHDNHKLYGGGHAGNNIVEELLALNK